MTFSVRHLNVQQLGYGKKTRIILKWKKKALLFPLVSLVVTWPQGVVILCSSYQRVYQHNLSYVSKLLGF